MLSSKSTSRRRHAPNRKTAEKTGKKKTEATFFAHLHLRNRGPPIGACVVNWRGELAW
jgi:hypothetical protein